MSSLFKESHHFGIDTLNHTHIAQQTHVYNQAPTVDPISILNKARAKEATHASKTASYAPKCKPGSRVKVIQDILDWGTTDRAAADPESPEFASILWLQGPAGGGKTCIMREVVSRCEEAGMRVASYFFSTRVAGLDQEEPFVATVAHQWATGDLKPLILQAISDNPAIFDESLERQAMQLLVKPLLSHDKCDTIIAIVDGLDECREAEGRRQRVHLFSIFRMLVTALPILRIAVASRPELDIRTAFTSQDYTFLTHNVRLQDYDGTFDIQDYLCDEFHRIRETHPCRGIFEQQRTLTCATECFPLCTKVSRAWQAQEIIEAVISETYDRISKGGHLASPDDPFCGLNFEQCVEMLRVARRRMAAATNRPITVPDHEDSDNRLDKSTLEVLPASVPSIFMYQWLPNRSSAPGNTGGPTPGWPSRDIEAITPHGQSHQTRLRLGSSTSVQKDSREQARDLLSSSSDPTNTSTGQGYRDAQPEARNPQASLKSRTVAESTFRVRQSVKKPQDTVPAASASRSRPPGAPASSGGDKINTSRKKVPPVGDPKSAKPGWR